MPTYSYKCTQCEQAFDIHQSFTDDTLSICPQCGGALRKVFSPIGVTFNGSGFYHNDSRANTRDHATKHQHKKDVAAASTGSGSTATGSTGPASGGSGSSAGGSSDSSGGSGAKTPAKSAAPTTVGAGK
ncbi:MAG: FmdB family zinc ribbon protein [Microbacteriaceae bacterium]